MKILILTAKFGMGHWSASQSLGQEFTRTFPAAEVEIEDLFASALPNTAEAMYKAFQLLVTYGGGLYNAMYKLTENGKPDTLPLFALPLVERLGHLIDHRQPDAVVATHPFCAQAVSRYKEESGSTIPLITCVTDITAHSEWLCGGTDCYLVGANAIKETLMEKGVCGDKILVTGIPVKLEFNGHTNQRQDGRRELLIMGGGLGILPKEERFYEGLNALPHIHTTIITGRNEKLYHRLHGKYQNIEVVGFTSQVHDYMARAHLVLTKPGGITVFECISSQLPILAWEPFLEQERHNARFLLRHGVGRVAPKEWDGCLAAITKLINDDATLDWMRGGMTRLRSELTSQGLTQIIAQMASGVCA